jgi:hypothetical protein
MSECPHLVIGMSGRCGVVFPSGDPSCDTNGYRIVPSQDHATECKSSKGTLRSQFGNAEDVRKAIEDDLDNSQDNSDKRTAQVFHAVTSRLGLLK